MSIEYNLRKDNRRRPGKDDIGKRVGLQKSGTYQEYSREGTIVSVNEVGDIVVQWSDRDVSDPLRATSLILIDAELEKQDALHVVIESLMEARRASEPAIPWDIVRDLAVLVLENHSEIIMVMNIQMQSLLSEAGKTLPDGVSNSDIAGRLNPLIIELRSKLKS